MKKIVIIFKSLLIVFSSCDSSGKIETGIRVDSNSSILSIKSGMTFFDSDSIYRQKFITNSINDGTKLFWKIEIYEDNKMTKTIMDSSDHSMSYLVDACDLNMDGTGELVVVSSNDNIECQIYCYIKNGNDWTKRAVPELNKKLLVDYDGMEVVTVNKNKIIRKYPIMNKEKRETGKERTLSYQLNNQFEFVVKQEK